MPRNDDGEMHMIPMAMLRRVGIVDDEPEKKGQPLLGQVADLEAVYQCYAERCAQPALEPGDLVHEREGMHITMNKTPVLVIMRYLDLELESDRETSAMASLKFALVQADVIVACKDSDGDLRCFPHESWRLEPYTGERP